MTKKTKDIDFKNRHVSKLCNKIEKMNKKTIIDFYITLIINCLRRYTSVTQTLHKRYTILVFLCNRYTLFLKTQKVCNTKTIILP
jgi:hypothetical protein